MNGNPSSDQATPIERTPAASRRTQISLHGRNAGRKTRVYRSASAGDKAACATYIELMRTLLILALFGLLALSVWFAGAAWEHLAGDALPFYGYVAIAGGVLVSLLVGGGLMGLVFYSSRHGYDDMKGGE